MNVVDHLVCPDQLLIGLAHLLVEDALGCIMASGGSLNPSASGI
jgi:hypothetical protein